MSKNIRIIGPAIRVIGGIVVSQPTPAGHRQVFDYAAKLGYIITGCEKGFLTSDDRFVGRCAAREIADAAGQIVRSTGAVDELNSEGIP